MGFLVLIILTGVVIAIVASSCSGNKNYSEYHDGYVRDSPIWEIRMLLMKCAVSLEMGNGNER